MPTMTASTSTLTPEEMTLPSTRLGQERGLAEQAERDQHEAGQRRQLELDQRDEELDRQDKEGEQHHEPGEQQHDDLDEVLEERDVAHQSGDRSRDRLAGIEPDLGEPSGTQEIGAESAEPEAFRPRPAKLSKTIAARLLQLPIRKAKKPTIECLLDEARMMSSSAPQAQNRPASVMSMAIRVVARKATSPQQAEPGIDVGGEGVEEVSITPTLFMAAPPCRSGGRLG